MGEVFALTAQGRTLAASKDMGEVFALTAECRTLAASKDVGEAFTLTAQGRTLAASSLTDIYIKAETGQGMAEDGSGTIRGPEVEKEAEATREQQDEQYWSVYAIKRWIREWFKRHPMKSWSIGNYDGQESYNSRKMKLTAQHYKEMPMESTTFHQMRSHMLAIEMEMDDALSTKELTTKERKREWHRLKDLVLSICDDYHPDVLHYNAECSPGKMVAAGPSHFVLTKSHAMGSQPSNAEATTTDSTQSSYISEEQFHYHDETRDDRVGRNHVVSVKDQGESNGEANCCQSKDEIPEDPAEATTITKPMAQTKAWQSRGQAYRVHQWNEASQEDVDGPTIGCMMAATTRSRRRQRREDLDTDDESEELVCNMTGESWESFPFPIIIDSGACASVMPTTWCNHVPVTETPQSKAGDYYRAANGQKIYQEGERTISMMTQEGALRDMRFIVCDVAKALGSVSQMCKTGHRVVFNPPWSAQGSYIQHVSTGEKMWLQEEGGLYVLKPKVAPKHRQTGRRRAADFHWQVPAQ